MKKLIYIIILAGSRSYFPYPENDPPDSTRFIRENDEVTGFEGYLTDILGERCVEFIDRNKDNPFFISGLQMQFILPCMQLKKTLQCLRSIRERNWQL